MLFYLLLVTGLSVRANLVGGGRALNFSDSNSDTAKLAFDDVVFLQEEIVNQINENHQVNGTSLYDEIELPLKHNLNPIEGIYQVVNGLNFWMKISIENHLYCHVWIYHSRTADPQLEAFEYVRKLDDPVTMFRKITLYKE